jgi:hypothetical protein
MNEAYRLTSCVGKHIRLYVVEDARTGEWLFWDEDGADAYHVMLVANAARESVS